MRGRSKRVAAKNGSFYFIVIVEFSYDTNACDFEEEKSYVELGLKVNGTLLRMKEGQFYRNFQP